MKPKKSRLKKIFTALGVALAIGGLFVIGAGTAHAADPQPPDFFSCVFSLPTCSLYLVSLAINSILGLLISLAALLVQAILGLNNHVFDSPAVQSGFSVSLAFANLGFVLAIIVIAIATILRSHTYGIKALFWKLLVMAILVNFGLVIAAPIVNFAGSITDYFVKASTPTGAGGVSDFVMNMTNAFAPQSLFSSNPLNGPSADNFFKAFLSLIFGIVFEGVMLLALVALDILLLVRYVYLGMLLILLPIAWLLWIFPKFSHYFESWWSSFIKWSFFPAVAMFFIWLAFQTAAQTAQGKAYLASAMQVPASAPSDPTSAMASISKAMNGSDTGIIQTALDETLLVGLMIGGLFAASSLSGHAGALATQGASAAAMGVTRFAGKQTLKGGRLVYQKADKAIEKATGAGITQRLREGRVGPLKIVPGARRVASLAGAELAEMTSNKALVEQASQKVPDDVDAIKSELIGSRNKEFQFAAIAKLMSKGELEDGTMINGKTFKEWKDDNKDAFERFGQNKLYKDSDKAIGSNAEMRGAEKEYKNLAKSGKDVTKAMQALREATQQFVEKMEKGDIAKINVSSVLGKNPGEEGYMLSQELSRQFALSAPQLVPAALPRMRSKSLKSFNGMYTQLLNDMLKEAQQANNTALIEHLSGKMVAGPRGQQVRGKGVIQNYAQSYGNNVTGFVGGGFGASGGGGATHP